MNRDELKITLVNSGYRLISSYEIGNKVIVSFIKKSNINRNVGNILDQIVESMPNSHLNNNLTSIKFNEIINLKTYKNRKNVKFSSCYIKKTTRDWLNMTSTYYGISRSGLINILLENYK